MIHNYRMIVTCLFISILNACQNAPQKNVDNPLETQAKESDLIMMPSKASGSKANSSYPLKPMPLVELRSCAQSLYDIKKVSTALKVQNTGLEKRKVTLSETEQSLIERRLKIDTHNTELIKEFNQEGNKYFESVKQLQIDLNKYNNQVNKSNQEINAFTKNCSNRAYKASDLHELAPNLIDIMQNNSESLDVPLFENTSSDGESDTTKSGGNNSAIHLPGSSRK